MSNFEGELEVPVESSTSNKVENKKKESVVDITSMSAQSAENAANRLLSELKKQVKQEQEKKEVRTAYDDTKSKLKACNASIVLLVESGYSAKKIHEKLSSGFTNSANDKVTRYTITVPYHHLNKYIKELKVELNENKNK